MARRGLLAAALLAAALLPLAARAFDPEVAFKANIPTKAPEHCTTRIRKTTKWGVATAAYQVGGGRAITVRPAAAVHTHAHDAQQLLAVVQAARRRTHLQHHKHE